MEKLRIELLRKENELFFHKENSNTTPDELLLFDWCEVALFRFHPEDCWVNIRNLTCASLNLAESLLETLSIPFRHFPHSVYTTFFDGLSYAPEQVLKNDKPILYGGSFNPLHEGHLECIRQGQRVNDVIVVPDRNPWKASVESSSKCPFHQFLTLLQELEHFNVGIYPGFLARRGVNPTIDWLPKTTFSQKELIFGDDSFLSLPYWTSSEELLKTINSLYVVPRFHKRLDLISCIDSFAKENPQINLILLDEHPYAHLSSSKIRKDI